MPQRAFDGGQLYAPSKGRHEAGAGGVPSRPILQKAMGDRGKLGTAAT